MQLSYKIKNLRTIKDSPWIDIRPITILVGKNSAGKSTFLRTFPLLKQSIETRGSAPILWWGEQVDFGSYRSAVSNKDDSQDISFEFKLSDVVFDVSPFGESRYITRVHRKEVAVDEVTLKVVLCSRGGKTRYRQLVVRSSGTDKELRIEFSSNSNITQSIFIGDTKLTEILPDFGLFFSGEEIFEQPLSLQLRTLEGKRRFMGQHYSTQISDQLNQSLSEVASKRLNHDRIRQVCTRVLGHPISSDTSISELAGRPPLVSMQRLYDKIDNGEAFRERSIFQILGATHHLFDTLDHCLDLLRAHFESVEYIGPARVRSERFYRQQELQVQNISPDGQNLLVFPH